jgi:hypothetical protein
MARTGGDILDMPSGPRRGDRMTCTFRLVTVDGAPVDPPLFTTVAPKWEPGDTIPLGRRTLRVLGVRYDDDQPTVLIVEDMSE